MTVPVYFSLKMRHLTSLVKKALAGRESLSWNYCYVLSLILFIILGIVIHPFQRQDIGLYECLVWHACLFFCYVMLLWREARLNIFLWSSAHLSLSSNSGLKKQNKKPRCLFICLYICTKLSWPWQYNLYNQYFLLYAWKAEISLQIWHGNSMY